MSVIYFKDHFADSSDCRISIHDRAFRFGDAVFDTLLVARGCVYDFHAHLKRLQHALQAVHIPFDIGSIPEICHTVIQRNNVSEGVVRIMISRGEETESAVGYLPKSTTPYVIIQAVALPYPAFREITLWQSSHPVATVVPFKTHNALLYTLAMIEAEAQGCHNALLLDAQGHVCETASGNLFWIKEDTLYTPAESLSLIPGTMRSKVLQLWRGKVEQGNFTIHALAAADEVWMTGSGLVLAAITAIKPLGIEYPVGKYTQEMRRILDADILNTRAI